MNADRSQQHPKPAILKYTRVGDGLILIGERAPNPSHHITDLGLHVRNATRWGKGRGVRVGVVSVLVPRKMHDAGCQFEKVEEDGRVW